MFGPDPNTKETKIQNEDGSETRIFEKRWPDGRYEKVTERWERIGLGMGMRKVTSTIEKGRN